jgi:HJR/Mrr/RecB family endonuclease
LAAAGIIEPVAIATRSGQVILYQLTDFGRTACESVGIDPGPRPRASLEHAFWVMRAAEHFEAKGYVVTREHVIKGNGAVDLLAERHGSRIAIEVETGKSDIPGNLSKVLAADFDGVVLVATSPVAVTACQEAIASVPAVSRPRVPLMTWLDL